MSLSCQACETILEGLQFMAPTGFGAQIVATRPAAACRTFDAQPFLVNLQSDGLMPLPHQQ